MGSFQGEAYLADVLLLPRPMHVYLAIEIEAEDGGPTIIFLDKSIGLCISTCPIASGERLVRREGERGRAAQLLWCGCRRRAHLSHARGTRWRSAEVQLMKTKTENVCNTVESQLKEILSGME